MITYQCDQCGKTETNMVGWYIVRIVLLYNDPQTPTPPAPMTEETKPDYIFDTKGCRTQWLAGKGLV